MSAQCTEFDHRDKELLPYVATISFNAVNVSTSVRLAAPSFSQTYTRAARGALGQLVPDTALAKLHIGYFVQDLALDPSAPPGDRMFTDYLHMIRVAGGWRIVARIYTASDAAPSG